MDLKHSAGGAGENSETFIATSKSTDMITPKEKEGKGLKVAGGHNPPAEGESS